MDKKSKTYAYYAFISYKHSPKKENKNLFASLLSWFVERIVYIVCCFTRRKTDDIWAEKIKEDLEKYRLPTKLQKEKKISDNRIYPVFRDKTDLKPGVLETNNREAVENSKYLIIICSHHAAAVSENIDKEITWFCNSRKNAEDYIIPIIVENSLKPEEECFPAKLKEICKTKTILGANIYDFSYRRAFLKIIASIHRIDVEQIEKLDSEILRKKRVIWGVIALILTLFAGFAANYYETHRAWNGSASKGFKNGNGTKEEPYEISQPEELAYLALITNSGLDTSGIYYQLKNDIYINRITTWNDDSYETLPNGEKVMMEGKRKRMMKEWVPIGNNQYTFNGVFDGNDRCIYGVFVDEDNSDYIGLFGNCGKDSVIENVTIVDGYFASSDGKYVGGIAGKSDGLINRCTSLFTHISGVNYVGSIVGNGNVIVNSSHIIGWVAARVNREKSDDEVSDKNGEGCYGGICGECDYLLNSSSFYPLISVENRGREEYAGGLAGKICKSIHNCVAAQTYYPEFFDEKKEKDDDHKHCICVGGYNSRGNKYNESSFVYSVQDLPIRTALLETKAYYINGSLRNGYIWPEKIESVKYIYDYDLISKKYNTLTIPLSKTSSEKSAYLDIYNKMIEENKNTYNCEVVKTLNSHLDLNSYNKELLDELLYYEKYVDKIELMEWVINDKNNDPGGFPTLKRNQDIDEKMYDVDSAFRDWKINISNDGSSQIEYE